MKIKYIKNLDVTMTSLSDLFDVAEGVKQGEMNQIITTKCKEFLQCWPDSVQTAVKNHVAKEDRRFFYLDIFNWKVFSKMDRLCGGMGREKDSVCWRMMMRVDSLRETFIEQLRMLINGKYATIELMGPYCEDELERIRFPIIRLTIE